jgi:beta-glucanase (GH16 family)
VIIGSTLYGAGVPQIDRRSMMMMSGMAALGAAALPSAVANASPTHAPMPAQPPDTAQTGGYLFVDEFDGPAGSAPDPSKWTVQSWDDPVNPPVIGHYRDDRRNVFVDGNSNLVLCATKEENQYFSGKVLSKFRGQIGTTWEARIKFDCMFPGLWPAYWLLNQDPLPDGEVDIVEYYGNEAWPPGTTVHAASNGKTWEGMSIPELVDPAWHSWRTQWTEDGFSFWRDYVDGAEPYFTVPAKPIQVHGRPGDLRWPFGNPGYWLQAILNLAVGGSGGGDPARAPYPSVMLVDYVRVW